jgi:hypothetical protein
MKALDQLEPLLRRVKFAINEGKDAESALHDLYEAIETPAETAIVWLHAHQPEFAELEVPGEAIHIARLWEAVESVWGRPKYDRHRETLLELHALVARIREQLRKRFRYVDPPGAGKEPGRRALQLPAHQDDDK